MDNKTIRQKYGLFVWVFLMFYRILIGALVLSLTVISVAMIFGLSNLAWEVSSVGIVVFVMLTMFVFPYMVVITEIYMYPK